jgi:hypothetical protein
MLPKRKAVPIVEQSESRILLSSLGAVHRHFVDVTGEIMRQTIASAPGAGTRPVQVYSLAGTGGVAELGKVQTSGSVTETYRNGSRSFRGTVTLSNPSGSVNISFRTSSYKIVGGTGVYKGATGLGAVSIGTSGGVFVGMAFSADSP